MNNENSVKVSWRDNVAPEDWRADINEIYISVLQVFGLPGERFTCHPQINGVEIRFNSKKDTEICRLLLSEKL